MHPEGAPFDTMAAVASAPVNMPELLKRAEKSWGWRVVTDTCAQYMVATFGLFGAALVLFAVMLIAVLPPAVNPFCFAKRQPLSRLVLGGLLGDAVHATAVDEHCVPLVFDPLHVTELPFTLDIAASTVAMAADSAAACAD